MSKDLKVNYGKTSKILPIPTCHNCEKFVSELWECNTCGRKFCVDHIAQEGNGFDDVSFICTDCLNKRKE